MVLEPDTELFTKVQNFEEQLQVLACLKVLKDAMNSTLLQKLELPTQQLKTINFCRGTCQVDFVPVQCLQPLQHPLGHK
jgi:hypothetical protein